MSASSCFDVHQTWLGELPAVDAFLVLPMFLRQAGLVGPKPVWATDDDTAAPTIGGAALAWHRRRA